MCVGGNVLLHLPGRNGGSDYFLGRGTGKMVVMGGGFNNKVGGPFEEKV